MSTTGHATGRAHPDAVDARPALQLVCAGVPTLLTEEEVDLVDLVNRADDVIGTLLDLVADPDEYRLAEVLIEHLCRRYGVERHADGDRIASVQSILRRYLIPFLVESDASRPEGHRGVGALRITHLERLPRVLSGDLPQPAATVAGDQLGRRGVACLYLSLPDAARVTQGGKGALEGALAAGSVRVHTDARTGHPVIFTLDLRRAALLRERSTPHGLRESTAGNVLRDLKLAIERARAHGANVRGTFQLAPIKPLSDNLAHQPRTGQRQVTLPQTAALAGRMSVIAQVVLWIGRLVGTRIGEVYGLLVCDYFRDEHGRPWLDFSKQGGQSCLVRDPATGRLVPQDRKPRTKTPKGERCIPIPGPLGDLLDRLIEAFHQDPETGQVDYAARLVPGIGKEDASGQSTFRAALDKATQALGLATSPHGLRDCLITDLRNAGIDERVRHFYAGHELANPTIQERHYDLGVAPEMLFEITDLLEAKIRFELGSEDLRVPTAVTHQWGKNTTANARRAHITHVLATTGWAPAAMGGNAPGRELSVAEVARRIDKHVSRTRALMREGTIRAHHKPWGTRPVWCAYEVDVEAYLASVAGMRIDDLAAEVGWSYHQVRHVLIQLGLMPTHRDLGERVVLDERAVGRFRAEATRRRGVLDQAMRLSEVAQVLDIPVVSVETLVGQGLLTVITGPTGGRDRWVTRTSLEAYQQKFPAATETADQRSDVQPLTFTEARRILGVTRHQLRMLTTTRQLRVEKIPGSRHVYVNTRSALRYAERTGRASAAARLEQRIAGV